MKYRIALTLLLETILLAGCYRIPAPPPMGTVIAKWETAATTAYSVVPAEQQGRKVHVKYAVYDNGDNLVAVQPPGGGYPVVHQVDSLTFDIVQPGDKFPLDESGHYGEWNGAYWPLDTPGDVVARKNGVLGEGELWPPPENPPVTEAGSYETASNYVLQRDLLWTVEDFVSISTELVKRSVTSGNNE